MNCIKCKQKLRYLGDIDCDNNEHCLLFVTLSKYLMKIYRITKEEARSAIESSKHRDVEQ